MIETSLQFDAGCIHSVSKVLHLNTGAERRCCLLPAVLPTPCHVAMQRLQATQSRVDRNLQRVADLKAEAAALERLQQSTGPVASAQAVPSSSQALSSLSRGSTSTGTEAAASATTTVSTSRSSSSSTVATRPSPAQQSSASSTGSSRPRQPRGSSMRPDRGLRSSLEAEQPLKEFWFPAEFTSQLGPNTLVPFELFDEPWVLFRWVAGGRDGRQCMSS